MVDTVNKETRSRMMSSVRAKDTKLELEMRRRLFAMGFRYRLHGKELPGTVVTVDEFTVKREDGTTGPITQMPVEAPKMFDAIGNPEKVLHMVPVRWIKTVSLSEAIKEKGFFGNQNTVAKPRAKKWVHTVERLKKRFAVDEPAADS